MNLIEKMFDEERRKTAKLAEALRTLLLQHREDMRSKVYRDARDGARKALAEYYKGVPNG